MKILMLVSFVPLLAACNFTSQLDRDIAVCITMVKGGAKCSTETTPAPATTPVAIPVVPTRIQ